MIELASLRDLQEILELINRSNREAFQGIIPREHFREPILTLDGLLRDFSRMPFYVYRREGRVAGVAALRQEDTASGTIRWVYILPEQQRKGIGTALVTFVEEEARKVGLHRLRLRTVEKAHWAVSFYHKLGYRLAKRLEVPWGYDVILEKDLWESGQPGPTQG